MGCQSIQSRCQNSFWAGVGKGFPMSSMFPLGLMHPLPWRTHLLSLGLSSSLLERGWETLLAAFPPFQLEPPQVPQCTPRGFPTLLQRPSQENTNRGIISVPLPRTQFLFINGFLYFTEHLMENRRIKQATGTTRPSPCWPGLHNKQLCQPRQHLKPKAEPSPRHFQLELLALL